MSYRIAQSQSYVAHDYWNWSAWIEAPLDDLRALDRVIWILHPTFSPSRVESTSAETNFRLDTSGWGTFLLRAELRGRDGSKQMLSHQLELTSPSGDRRSAAKETDRGPAARPYVFMSYSSEDATHANAARHALTNLGVRVLDATQVEAGSPFDASIRKLIRESAGVVSIVGSNYTSPYVIGEMKLAVAEEKTAVALLPDGVTRPSELASDVQELRFDTRSGGLEQPLAAFVGELRSRGSLI